MMIPLLVLFLSVASSGTMALSALPGSFDRTSPVIIDNDAFSEDWTLEYVLAMAALGQLNLQGIIGCKAGRDGVHIYSTASQAVEEAKDLISLARESGMTVAKNPVRGANAGLVEPSSHRIGDTRFVTTRGSRLIVSKALNASPTKPLIVMVGGHLADVATAYLDHPSIANRMVVYWIGGRLGLWSDYNSWTDYWAAWIVGRRLTMVMFPANLMFTRHRPQIPFNRFGEMPANVFTNYLRVTKSPHVQELYPRDESDVAVGVYATRQDFVTGFTRATLVGRTLDRNGLLAPYAARSSTGNLYVITSALGNSAGRAWLNALKNPAAYE